MSNFLKDDIITKGLIGSIIQRNWRNNIKDINKAINSEELIRLCEIILNYENEEIFEEIPESIYVPFDKPTNSLKKDEHIEFFKNKGVILYDGIYAAASSFNYVYRNKGERIILFENGDIILYSNFSRIDQEGFCFINEWIDKINIYVSNQDDIYSFSSVGTENIGSIEFWVRSLININKTYNKAYYLEYLLNPPDVTILSDFSAYLRKDLYGCILYLAEEIIIDSQNQEKLDFFEYILNFMYSMDIEADAKAILQLFKFVTKNDGKIDLRGLELILDKLEDMNENNFDINFIGNKINEIKEKILLNKMPIVLTEGETDPIYIKTSLKLMGRSDLLDKVRIEWVGGRGENGSIYNTGDTGLNNTRNVILSNLDIFQQKILLLYDCDTKKPDENKGGLFIKHIPFNKKNKIIKKGIENLLSEHLFEKRFYRTKEIRGDYGETKYYEEFNKTEFCDYVCNIRHEKSDFDDFGEIIKILEEFVRS